MNCLRISGANYNTAEKVLSYNRGQIQSHFEKTLTH